MHQRQSLLVLLLHMMLTYWSYLTIMFLSYVNIMCELNGRNKHVEAAVVNTCLIHHKGKNVILVFGQWLAYSKVM